MSNVSLLVCEDMESVPSILSLRIQNLDSPAPNNEQKRIFSYGSMRWEKVI